MNLIFFYASCGVGMESATVQDVNPAVPEAALEAEAYFNAVHLAEQYGEFVGDNYPEEDDEFLVISESDLHYYYMPYDPSIHDDMREGGGSFMDDFTSKR